MIEGQCFDKSIRFKNQEGYLEIFDLLQKLSYTKVEFVEGELVYKNKTSDTSPPSRHIYRKSILSGEIRLNPNLLRVTISQDFKLADRGTKLDNLLRQLC